MESQADAIIGSAITDVLEVAKCQGSLAAPCRELDKRRSGRGRDPPSRQYVQPLMVTR